MVLSLADRLALGAIEASLHDARDAQDERPAFEVLTDSLAALQARGISSERTLGLVLRERDAWLHQLQDAQRSKGTIALYRAAIDDLLAWAQRERRTEDLIEQQAIVDYLDDYRKRRDPAPRTFLKRFTLLRYFMAWLGRRHGTPSPFAGLKTPSAHREPEWLTRGELTQLLEGR
jgi:site-specific recombinase XerC